MFAYGSSTWIKVGNKHKLIYPRLLISCNLGAVRYIPAMVARGRIHLSPQAAEHLEFAKDIHRRDILSARGTSTTALILSSSLELSADAH